MDGVLPLRVLPGNAIILPHVLYFRRGTLMAIIKAYLHALHLFCYVSFIWTDCIGYPSPGLLGYYCTHDDAIVLPFLLEHECTLACVQKARCVATNYNISDSTCSLLPSACLQASNDSSMIYTIFTSSRDQCLGWHDYSPGDPIDDRWLKTKVGGDAALRAVTRTADNGHLYPGNFLPNQKRCVCTDGVGYLNSDKGYPCQVLRLGEGCTAAYVPYTAGDVIPDGAVGIKSPEDGSSRYIAIIDNREPIGPVGHNFIGGYYMAGDAEAVYLFYGIKYSSQMELVVVIWSPTLRILCWCPMITTSNGNISSVTGHRPLWIPVTGSFDVFCFYLCLNKRLSKQSIRHWDAIVTHHDVTVMSYLISQTISHYCHWYWITILFALRTHIAI